MYERVRERKREREKEREKEREIEREIERERTCVTCVFFTLFSQTFIN